MPFPDKENSKFFSNGNICISESSCIDGDGLIEESVVIHGELRSRFVVGSYTSVGVGAKCSNALIGRFSTIEENSIIGYRKIRGQFFSNHGFAHAEKFEAEDEFLSKIKTNRNFRENEKYCFIGHDVLVGRGSVIEEGVCVGDGAIILPGSYVNSDVPPFSVVSGQPASVLSYRFPKYEIDQLISSKWWLKDISVILSKYYSLDLMDYGDISDLISRVYQSKLPTLKRKMYWINTGRKVFEENKANNIIIGPSHIDIWNRKFQRGSIEKPEKYHLYPIPAVSAFSEQLSNLVRWWSSWVGNVLVFVPDFRIGNLGMKTGERDTRFIKQGVVSDQNSKDCYLAGVSALDLLRDIDGVRFWFWCLNGREEINKNKKIYVDSAGRYKHPLWNYEHMLKRYGETVINIQDFFPKIENFIIDASIHPTDECYTKMINIFDNYQWN